MKKRPGREALALSIYIYIIFLGYHFFRYHFSPVPFHVHIMYVSYTPHVHPQKNSGKKHTLFLPGV